MSILFPRPFAIAIDDLGWINGQNEGEDGYGPYRLGINRRMRVKDYEAVADLARKAGVRLQGLFILGEMDRENFLGQYPHTTHLREKWDNQANISDLQVAMMEYVKKQAAHIEFGLHGVGHEFWPEAGVRRRAEWYNTVDNHPWPEEQIREHVECFIRIMRQYGISKEDGHSFPESFVPCAYSYYWNPAGAYSLGSVLGDYGVRYANTDFTQIPECNPPADPNGGGFDHRVHVMNRYNYGNLWYELGKLPTVPLAEQPTDFIETHWPNLLAQDDFLQEDVTDRWVKYYEAVQGNPLRYCAKNTAQMHSQWQYRQVTKLVETHPGTVELDNRAMPESTYRGYFPTNLVLKIRLEPGQHVASATLNGETVPAYFEDQGYGFLYLQQLMPRTYTLRYSLGTTMLQNTVWHDGTSNIFDVTHKDGETKIDLCLYGSQQIKLLRPNTPESVKSNNPGIRIKEWHNEGPYLVISAEAHDLQGELGSVRVRW